jgi:hypothetical protein
MVSPLLEKLRQEILAKMAVDLVTEAGREKQAKTILGMEDLPVNKMMKAVQYIENNLLPAVKKKSGDKSPDFVFFEDVAKMLLHAIIIHDRYREMERRYVNARIDRELLRERLALTEREMDKYATMEDLWLSESLDHISKGVRARAESLLEGKKR